MGCHETRNRFSLTPEKIIEEINEFFKMMKVRQFPIEQLSDKIVSTITRTSDIQEWKALLREELCNTDYNSTVNHLVNSAMDDAKNGHGDSLLPLLSLLFLSQSNRDNFINSYKSLNLTKKTQNAGNEVMNAIDNGLKVGLFAGIVTGLGALQNVKGAVSQVSNPSIVRKYDLKNLILFYINFLTLLPVISLENNNEIKKTKSFYIKVLKNAFGQKEQKEFVDDNFFKNYNQEEIKIEEFFGEHLTTLKNDDNIRFQIVNKYINSLSRDDIKKIAYGI